MTWLVTGNGGTSTANFLGTTDARPLVIRTQNAERMRVSTGGDVSIGVPGTRSPDYTLDVGGILNADEIYEGGVPLVGSQWTEGAGGISYGGGSVGIGALSASHRLNVDGPLNATEFHENGVPLVSSQWEEATGGISYVAGNVGVGKAPGANYRLDVDGVINATDFHKGGSPLVSSQWGEVTGGISYGGGSVGVGKTPGASYRLDVGGAINATDFHKNGAPLSTSQWSDVSGGINYAGGRVGIGTSAPQGRLDVRGDIRAGNSDVYFTRTDHNHTGIGNTAGFAALENAADYGALMILGRAGTPRGRYVRLWDYLQVNGGLEVIGSATVRGSLGFGNATTPMLYILESGTANPERPVIAHSPSYPSWGLSYRDTEDKMIFQGGGQPVMTLSLGASTVGIGTANPLVKLHAVGNRIRLDNGAGRTLDLRADGSALDLESNGGDLYINNNNVPVRIRNLIQGSSRVLKESIADFTVREAMEALDGLKAVSFSWKDDQKKTSHLGFVAEDTPVIAATPDKTGIIPMHILAILSKVVQEQQRTIDSMRRELGLRDGA